MLPGRGHVNRYHTDLPFANKYLELVPLDSSQARETIHVLYQQHVVRPTVSQKAKQFGARKVRARFILDLIIADNDAMVVCKAVQHAACALGILFVGGSPQVGANEGCHVVSV